MQTILDTFTAARFDHRIEGGTHLVIDTETRRMARVLPHDGGFLFTPARYAGEICGVTDYRNGPGNGCPNPKNYASERGAVAAAQRWLVDEPTTDDTPRPVVRPCGPRIVSVRS